MREPSLLDLVAQSVARLFLHFHLGGIGSSCLEEDVVFGTDTLGGVWRITRQTTFEGAFHVMQKVVQEYCVATKGQSKGLRNKRLRAPAMESPFTDHVGYVDKASRLFCCFVSFTGYHIRHVIHREVKDLFNETEVSSSDRRDAVPLPSKKTLLQSLVTADFSNNQGVLSAEWNHSHHELP
jgi:hypothetical protein